MNEPLEEAMGQSLRDVRASFLAHIEPHRRSLWHYCLRLTGSVWDAEDLVQDTVEKALAGLANLWQPVHPRAYLFRVATNLWIDRWRRQERAGMEELSDDVPARGPEPELRIEAHEALAHLVRVLTPLQRVVFLLCETLDFTARETATLLATTEGAVKASLHRARARLAVTPAPGGSLEARRRDTRETRDVVQRYIVAFDARDPDAIAALLHEDAVTTIVGSAEELGRGVSRRNSLAEWAADPVPQTACAGVLDGRDVIFVFADNGGTAPALSSLIALDVAGGEVLAQRIYHFSPELLEHAAAALGVPVRTHGHWYAGAEKA
jgi:RNA polymerase sigma-70 factor (ECF subfamily)